MPRRKLRYSDYILKHFFFEKFDYYGLGQKEVWFIVRWNVFLDRIQVC